MIRSLPLSFRQRDLKSQLNRESAAYAEGVNQPVGEKRKALKYIFTFTSTHRGLERNLSRSAFFMSFSLIACLPVGKEQPGGNRHDHNH